MSSWEDNLDTEPPTYKARDSGIVKGGPRPSATKSKAIAELASKININAIGGGGGDPYKNPNHPLYK
jgi:hypothetical protein